MALAHRSPPLSDFGPRRPRSSPVGKPEVCPNSIPQTDRAASAAQKWCLLPSITSRKTFLDISTPRAGSVLGMRAGLYGNRPATVFQKPMPLIRSNWMVTDLLLLNRMVIRSYQLVFAFCRTTWFAVIVTGSELYLQQGPVR